jgi:adenylate cyclase
MAGFTDFSEMADIRVLTRVLNVYMERMSAVVLEQGGTIDKYIGDAVMAFWNAPLEQPDHAARACRTALAMREAENQIREELLADAELRELLKDDPRTAASVAAMGRTALYTRIGINTGPMNVGNWGSARKFQYTVIGDAVNSGARLEPANKRYGTRMLISGSTAALIKGQFLLRRVDVTRVKGKAQAMEVFEVLAEGAGTAQQRELTAAYEAAFDLYSQRQWPAALERLAAMETRFAGDGPARMLAERISTLMADPHAPWDGVYTATDK